MTDDCLFTGRMQDNPEKDEPTPGSSPTAPSWPAPGGPTSLGGHVSTFGMASPAASSPVSAEVQHCALPMVAPRFGSRQQNTTVQSQCCAKISFSGEEKVGTPQQLGMFGGEGFLK